MSTGDRLPLGLVRERADELVDTLRPHCLRIEVAGSVRRQSPLVGDLELLVVPRWGSLAGGELGDLFGANLLAAEVRRLAVLGELAVLKPGTRERVPWEVRDDGRYWRLALRLSGRGEPDFPLDVFVQSSATWGLNLVIRTGSASGPAGELGFAPAVLRRWKALTGGGRAEGAQLYDASGRLHPTPEEEDVFGALEMPAVEPWRRVDYRAVPPVRGRW